MEESENIKIIKLEPKDWQIYKAIRLEALRMEPYAFNSKYQDVLTKPDSFWIDELSDESKIYLFATVSDEVVGTMNVSFNENNIKYEAVIHGAYVNISHRRKGIGKQLLTSLLEEVKKRGDVTTAKLWVKGSQIKARKFYEYMGFSVVDKDDKNTLIMEKSLR